MKARSLQAAGLLTFSATHFPQELSVDCGFLSVGCAQIFAPVQSIDEKWQST